MNKIMFCDRIILKVSELKFVLGVQNAQYLNVQRQPFRSTSLLCVKSLL